MTCEETQHLLDAYVDNELDWSVQIAVNIHLQECVHCAHVLSSLQSLVSALKRAALTFKAPQRLNAKVEADIQRAHSGTHPSFGRWHWAGIAAALVLVIALAWFYSATPRNSSLETQLVAEVISSHVRSMMADHVTDILSSDTHNVKPWFVDKLDYSPPTRDLSAQGFPLIGGRMDYLDNRPVAALVYRRNQHYINFFVWPVDQGQAVPETRSTVRGFNLIHWTHDGMTFWLISDLEPAQLSECAGLLKE
jgi:anti-sigma factor RsiW